MKICRFCGRKAWLVVNKRPGDALRPACLKCFKKYGIGMIG